MFAFVSSKVAMPKGETAASVGWSFDGWVAGGGSKGSVKMLKVPSLIDSKKGKLAAGADQALLKRHDASVSKVSWNHQHNDLSTSDANGLIVVWCREGNAWKEDMNNFREGVAVQDLRWSGGGQKICFGYGDGKVIVGTHTPPDRLFSSQVDFKIALLEWSPDARRLLAADSTGRVHVLEGADRGTVVDEVSIFAIDKESTAKIVGLEWFKKVKGGQAGGEYDNENKEKPTLLIVFDNGRAQIGRSEYDEDPVLLDTGLNVTVARWNADGSAFAIAGAKPSEANSAHVQFYSPFGRYLRQLTVPGDAIRDLAWDGDGLRLAMAVGTNLLFATVRPEYMWGYFSNTIVYSFSKEGRSESCVAFWDTISNDCHVEYQQDLVSLATGAENSCVIGTRNPEKPGKFLLKICDAIGSSLVTKVCELEPTHLSMTDTHVVAASKDHIYIWQYRALETSEDMSRRKRGSEVMGKGGKVNHGKSAKRSGLFHIDAVDVLSAGMPKKREVSGDPVVAVALSLSTLLIARRSGTVLQFSLLNLKQTGEHLVGCLPHKININSDSSRFSVIDIQGKCFLFELPVELEEEDDVAPDEGKKAATRLEFERDGVWDMKWSADNPMLFACMEKNRMYVFRDVSPEEPRSSMAYLCDFKDLCIKTVSLDDIMAAPETPDPNLFEVIESKSLRDTRQLLATTPIQEAFNFIEDNPHPRLWRLLTDTALQQLNFEVADKAMVRCLDYQGIQFVKRLQVLNEKSRQRAEVAAYFERYDEAEQLYMEMGAPELAIELRQRLGDWFRVHELLQGQLGSPENSQSSKSGNTRNKMESAAQGLSLSNDELLRTTWENLGDWYADRQRWSQAYEFYSKAGNVKALVEASYRLDRFDTLESLIDQVPEGDELLLEMGEKFVSVGLCEAAVRAFVKAGDAKQAINSCVLLHNWDRAVKLAHEHNIPEIEELLSNYASYLLASGDLFQAVDMYRKAKKHAEAGALLSRLAKAQAKPDRAKQLYVLSALEKQLAGGAQAKEGPPALTNPWHGAEAYHYMLLAHRLLYGSHRSAALRAALHLSEYEDVLEERMSAALTAFCAFGAGHYQECSKAFIKLETLDELKPAERAEYKKLACSIFVKFPPKEPAGKDLACPKAGCTAKVKDWFPSCPSCHTHYSACLLSGKSLFKLDAIHVVTCKTCKHHVDKTVFNAQKPQFCPLCHSDKPWS
eukprot:gb/GEZN01000783.1/.p1 GENE.gb/GEZN01000783.1/~~gb/GEZN01000783.1/.p1  ORF type:complete len:1200 (+),score=159.05 gb/GEZN01000783.1/:95-3694(+)